MYNKVDLYPINKDCHFSMPKNIYKIGLYIKLKNL